MTHAFCAPATVFLDVGTGGGLAGMHVLIDLLAE